MLAAFFIASQDKRNDKEKMLAVSKNRTIRPEELEVVVVAAISLLCDKKVVHGMHYGVH